LLIGERSFELSNRTHKLECWVRAFIYP